MRTGTHGSQGAHATQLVAPSKTRQDALQATNGYGLGVGQHWQLRVAGSGEIADPGTWAPLWEAPFKNRLFSARLFHVTAPHYYQLAEHLPGN